MKLHKIDSWSLQIKNILLISTWIRIKKNRIFFLLVFYLYDQIPTTNSILLPIWPTNNQIIEEIALDYIYKCEKECSMMIKKLCLLCKQACSRKMRTQTRLFHKEPYIHMYKMYNFFFSFQILKYTYIWCSYYLKLKENHCGFVIL